MSARGVRVLLATTVVAAVLSYGLSAHSLPQMSSQDGMAGAAAGLCLLLVTAIGFAVTAKPESRRACVVCKATAFAVAVPRPGRVDGRARASPSSLQRFRN